MPVFVMETTDTTVNKHTFQPEILSNSSNTIESHAENIDIANNSDWDEIKRYFNDEMKNAFSTISPHDESVIKTITKLFNSDYTNNK